MDTPTAASTPADRRLSSGQLTGLLGLALLAIGLAFAFDSADAPHWFALFKWIHVSVAVFWVGGGILLTVLGLKVEHSDDPNEIVTLARWAAWTGERLFAPAGGVVLAMGIAMLIHGGDPIVAWSKFWVIVGLIGYAVTLITGVAILSPQAKRIAELSDSRGPTAPETIAAIRRILVIARFDVAVLLVVVADMVTKPFS
ncbi:MAG TPA: DUF2269 family protein [Gaiellaceae bacterium]|nr:DUF2269 family protein [Gaiellaceae bacterium]